MPKYGVSEAAGSDVRGIIRYTADRWGQKQAVRYSAGLRKCFRLLAQSPGLGRESDEVSIGLRRFEHGKHVVFYRTVTDGIGIVRVLHQQMIPTKTRFEA